MSIPLPRGWHMSHFDSFQWDGGEIRLIPRDLRGFWPFRWAWVFPFPSGMKLNLRASIKIQPNYDLQKDEQIRIHLFRDGTEGTIGSAILISGHNQSQEIHLGRLTYSGTYRLNAYHRFGDWPSEELARGFAAIHIVPNYVAWLLLFNPIIALTVAYIISRLS